MDMEDLVNGWAVALATAAAVCVWAWWEHRKYSAQLASLNGALLEVSQMLAPLRGPSEFYQQFSSVARRLADSPVGARWKEYRATLLPARGDKPLRSPKSPKDYFEADLYGMGGVDIRAYEALPNQLVGVGLCLTFIGLVVTLLMAQLTLSAAGADPSVELSRLLQAATFKFFTSGAALLASIVVVSRKNHWLYEVERSAARFCDQLERLIPIVTPEELAEENNEELARQRKELATANESLATRIAEALEEKLTSAMTVATKPLVTSVDTMTTRLGDINRLALEHMAQRFSETLAGAAQNHMNQISAMLAATAEALRGIPTDIGSASNMAVTTMNDTSAALDAVGEAMVSRAAEITATIEAELRSGFSSKADSLSAEIRGSAAVLNSAIVSFGQAVARAHQEIGEAAPAVTEFRAAAGELTSAVRTASDGLAATLSRTGSRTDSMLETIDGIVASLHRAGAALEALEAGASTRREAIGEPQYVASATANGELLFLPADEAPREGSEVSGRVDLPTP